jgi:hypothetical protein
MAFRLALTLALIALTSGCDADASGDASPGGAGGSGAGGSSAGAAGWAGNGGAAGSAGGRGLSYSATLLERELLCKLISGAHLNDPTANQTHTRFNLKGTDLGIPLATGSELHLFFGDSVGYALIWDFGEDPDAVARVPLASATADPSSLCSQLDFYVTPDDPSVAAGVDPSIQRDFASAWMTPPPGEPIEPYIAQPPPGFPQIPGTFEVPSGAVEIGSKVYLTYAGAVELAPRTRATSSYLARWDAPGASLPGYQILFAIDRLAGGALGGHFIQIAPVVHDGTLYFFGSGNYRQSGIYLAKKPSAAIESAGGEEIFDPASNAWRPAGTLSQAEREAIAPLLESDGVGELSVQWLPEPGLFLLIHQRELHDAGGAIVDNRIVARVSPTPTGPWSEALTIVDMADPTFRAAHCCAPSTCNAQQILHCDKAGLYGAYALPTIGVTPSSAGYQLSIPFVVSTWDPYNVVLFQILLEVAPRP